ncbi:endonuclease/exonuclease/phosphatase family protein [Halothiobacillus sp. DCM-1]|uniref:endonuclease/exonuclease/phosphatase family protein n=1 Tax=Halothiobacillus sp. DCM-1 TaxID=3112558 RepID=UPI003255A630
MRHSGAPVTPLPMGARTLKLLSYNIQAGIGTQHFRDYVLRGWQHVLPFPERMHNLDQIAGLLAGFDLIGLQEADGGSLRSHFLNQIEYLALRAGLPFWASRVNRNLGHWGQHALGLLARQPATHIERFALPGRIPGRGVLLADFDAFAAPLRVQVSHLSLGDRARRRQLDCLIRRANEHNGINLIMADFNTTPANQDLQRLCREAGLKLPPAPPSTYPGWRPRRAIDHILVSESVIISQVDALTFGVSDHMPLAMTIELPPAWGTPHPDLPAAPRVSG